MNKWVWIYIAGQLVILVLTIDNTFLTFITSLFWVWYCDEEGDILGL